MQNRVNLNKWYKKERKDGKRRERRERKLLLHKNEILKINNEVETKRLTLIPLKIYFKNGKAKLELGVCQGKKLYDKRETIKKKDMKRDAEINIRKNI